MSIKLQDMIRYSAHCINCISKLGVDIAKRVRTRARQLFEVLTYQGLPHLFAYVGGKAAERALQDLYAAICRDLEVDKISSELSSIIKKWKLSEEDASYGLYGASIICASSKFLNKELKFSLEELICKYGFDRVTQRVALEAAKWIKFFAEAKLPAGD